MHLNHWILLLIANIPVYIFAGWMFFGNWNGFINTLCSTEWGSELWSKHEGTFRDTMKFWCWFLFCSACVIGEELLIILLC